MMIELVNVYKRLGGRSILNGLSVSIERGQTLAIVGPSGTGKSVTLNHIIGLMSPDRGSINVMGRDVAKLSYREMQKYRSKVGMLFQSGAQLPGDAGISFEGRDAVSVGGASRLDDGL